MLEQVKEIEGIETGLMADAQRFIVLGQTDSLWKEHLQASAHFASLHALYICAVFFSCTAHVTCTRHAYAQDMQVIQEVRAAHDPHPHTVRTCLLFNLTTPACNGV